MKRYLDRNRRLADYIYNDMDPEERLVIEEEILNDPEFSETHQLNRQVKDYLQAKIQLEEMKSDPQLENAEQLADMAFDVESHDKVEQETIPIGNRKRIRNITFAASIAATVAIVISVGIIPSSIDQDRLFDRYYEPIEASDFSQRGEFNELYGEIARGINFYTDGD